MLGGRWVLGIGSHVDYLLGGRSIVNIDPHSLIIVGWALGSGQRFSYFDYLLGGRWVLDSDSQSLIICWMGVGLWILTLSCCAFVGWVLGNVFGGGRLEFDVCGLNLTSAS